MHRISWRGPCSTWNIACMSGGIIKELVRVTPSIEVIECLQSLTAPSVAGAEPSLVSPSGAELEVMHQSMTQRVLLQYTCQYPWFFLLK